MNVSQWAAENYHADSTVVRLAAQVVPLAVAWLEAAALSFPLYAAIVGVDVTTAIDVNQFVLNLTWPTLTILALAWTYGRTVPDTRSNAGPPTE